MGGSDTFGRLYGKGYFAASGDVFIDGVVVRNIIGLNGCALDDCRVDKAASLADDIYSQLKYRNLMFLKCWK